MDNFTTTQHLKIRKCFFFFFFSLTCGQVQESVGGKALGDYRNLAHGTV
jgi:hypothetical protein